MASFGDTLLRLWPNGDQKIVGLRAGMIETAEEVFRRYGITSPLLIAQVMAQISHECGAGHDVVENLNYTAQRMTQVWPRRFPTVASAAPYANNPRALANKVYNGRMGNVPGSDDGWNFRGRGASQTTGREGYQRLAKAVGLDVVNNPDLVNNPKRFLECGVADFINCGCLPFAKQDDVLNVTRRLNGGTVGLQQREAWLAKWKAALGSGPVVFVQARAAQPSAVPSKADMVKGTVVGATTATVVTGVHRGWGAWEWGLLAAAIALAGLAIFYGLRWWRNYKAAPVPYHDRLLQSAAPAKDAGNALPARISRPSARKHRAKPAAGSKGPVRRRGRAA